MENDGNNSNIQVLELEKLLLNIEKYKWEYSVFLPEHKEWGLKTKCCLCNLNDLEDNELPEYVILNNFIEVLSIAELQDIVLNLKEQINNPCLEEIYKAFTYYYKNDSFIVI